MVDEQVTMQIFGACVMCLALVFISCACYAAWSAPNWSGKPRRCSSLIRQMSSDVGSENLNHKFLSDSDKHN